MPICTTCRSHCIGMPTPGGRLCGDDCHPCGTAAAADEPCALYAGAVCSAIGLCRLRSVCTHLCMVHSVSVASGRLLTTGTAQRAGSWATQGSLPASACHRHSASWYSMWIQASRVLQELFTAAAASEQTTKAFLRSYSPYLVSVLVLEQQQDDLTAIASAMGAALDCCLCK